MATAAPTQLLTPERIFNFINAHQQNEVFKAALELEIFTAIAEGHATADEIAKRCQCAERGVRIVCDFLTIHDFLTKNGDRYTLKPESALFLSRQSEAYIGSAIDFLLSPHLLEGHARLTEAVRRGGSALPGSAFLEPDNPDWVRFAEAMMPLMFTPAKMMAAELSKGRAVRKVLDIAAGHGIFGIAIALENLDARVYASDWGNVLQVAQKNAAAMGVADRYHLLPGNSFNADLGNGYDLVLVTNFLHHFDPPTCIMVLRKLNAAMIPGGRIAISELIPNPDRVTPPTAAAFSVMMLATTPAGNAYTFSELEQMLTEAGFAFVKMSEREIGINRLVIGYR